MLLSVKETGDFNLFPSRCESFTELQIWAVSCVVDMGGRSCLAELTEINTRKYLCNLLTLRIVLY